MVCVPTITFDVLTFCSLELIEDNIVDGCRDLLAAARTCSRLVHFRLDLFRRKQAKSSVALDDAECIDTVRLLAPIVADFLVAKQSLRIVELFHCTGLFTDVGSTVANALAHHVSKLILCRSHSH